MTVSQMSRTTGFPDEPQLVSIPGDGACLFTRRIPLHTPQRPLPVLDHVRDHSQWHRLFDLCAMTPVSFWRHIEFLSSF